MDIVVYYFPPEVEIPDALVEEMIPLDYEVLQQEYKFQYEQSGGVTPRYPQEQPDTVASFNTNRKKNNQHWCVAMEQSGDLLHLAGMVCLTQNIGFNSYPQFGRVPNCVVIQSLVVSARMRGKGVGTILLTYSYQMAKQWKVKNIALGVTQLNTNAVRLYEKLGYRTLETNFFGIPKKMSVSENFVPMIPQSEMTSRMKDKFTKEYHDYVARNSRQFYPLYGVTSEITEKTMKFIWQQRYPIFQFPNGDGWCVIDKEGERNISSFYPLCITPKGLQHPGQIKKCIYYMSLVGTKLFKSPLLWFSVIDPTLTKIIASVLPVASTTKFKSVY